MGGEMRRALMEQASRQVARIAAGEPSPMVSNVGAELELFLFRPGGVLASDAEKRKVVGDYSPTSDYGLELGAAAVEIHPGPVDLSRVGFAGWYQQLSRLERRLVQRARNQGFLVGRCGLIPWVSTRDVARTELEKYQRVPDFHNQNRPFWVPTTLGGVFVGDAAVVGLCNAFQFSTQAVGIADAVDKLNRLLMISPLAVALSANSRVLSCRDTGWEDARFEIWRRSHETRSLAKKVSGHQLRIGLPRRYYSGIESYLREIASYPFILDRSEAALPIGIGLSWRDARIKFPNGLPVVEFRPVATQPTLAEEIGLAAFVIGRLLWSQRNGEHLPRMAVVRRNKREAEHRGIRAKLLGHGGKSWWPVSLMGEIDRAATSLDQAGLLDGVAQRGLDTLCQRVRRRGTPSQLQPGLSREELTDLVVCR